MSAFQDYIDVMDAFNHYNVEYLVVGAYAMGNFGYTRSTHDIDLWVKKTKENSEKICRALEEFGIPFLVRAEDFMEDDSIIQIGLAPTRIDILTDIDGVDFDEAWKNKVDGKILGVSTAIISLNDLILNKTASNRDKDKLDLVQLKDLKSRKDDM